MQLLDTKTRTEEFHLSLSSTQLKSTLQRKIYVSVHVYFVIVVSKWRASCHCAPQASAAGNADRNHSKLMVLPGEVKHNNQPWCWQ